MTRQCQIFILVLMIGLVACTAFTLAAEIVIQPNGATGKDTWVGEDYPTSNHGTERWVYFGGYNFNEYRLYIQFDLTHLLPSSNVDTAQLEFYMFSQNGEITFNYSVFRITEAWGETTLNWNNQPLHAPLEAAYFSGLDWQGAYLNWHAIAGLGGLVQYWIDHPDENFGLVIQPSSSFYGYPSIWSSDGTDASLRPRLVINGGLVSGEISTWGGVKQLFR